MRMSSTRYCCRPAGVCTASKSPTSASFKTRKYPSRWPADPHIANGSRRRRALYQPRAAVHVQIIGATVNRHFQAHVGHFAISPPHRREPRTDFHARPRYARVTTGWYPAARHSRRAAFAPGHSPAQPRPAPSEPEKIPAVMCLPTGTADSPARKLLRINNMPQK